MSSVKRSDRFFLPPVSRPRDLGPPCPRNAKVSYRTKRKAIVALERLRNGGMPYGCTSRRIYPCPHCGFWHLTSQDRGR